MSVAGCCSNKCRLVDKLLASLAIFRSCKRYDNGANWDERQS